MNNNKIKMAVVGFGQRGIVFSEEAKKFPNDIELVAVCDTDISRFEYIKENYNLKDENLYSNFNEMMSKEKLADFLVIATPDRDHYSQAMKALDKGYHLLLEKPIALNREEIFQIKEKANKLNLKVSVAHVLRYTTFYQKIKDVIDSGIIGDVVTLTQRENIGYAHFAHSYVRGNWRNSLTSGPIILTKSSHDLDIIRYLMNAKVKKVSSFGNLYYFKKENKPEGMAKYSIDNKVFTPYDAYNFYKNNPDWMKFISLNENVDEVMSDKSHNYGISVFDSDNNVSDHQVVNLLFENNKTASFVLTAFSNKTHRTISIHGTLGEIVGDLESNKFSVSVYEKETKEIDVSDFNDDFSHHMGGDKQLLKDFVDAIKNDTDFITNINYSLESHYLAFAAEESRINEGKVIDMEKYFKDYE